MQKLGSACSALTAAVLLSACASGSDAATDDDRLQVTAALYPYAYLAERVGGEQVQVTSLTPPGAEPHDLELTPRQVAALGDSDLVVYAEGFQPAVDEAVEQQAQDKAFAVGEPSADEQHDEDEEGEHGAHDPHLWLDPTRYAQVAQELAERLGELDPDQAETFSSRADELKAELTLLDEELSDGLRRCKRREIVTSHDAFGHLAERYDLEQIAVTGLTPEEEPTPGRLAEVARLAEERGVTTVFFEELVSPRTAESLAREVGAKAVVLSPLESPPEQGDYLTAMRSNLQTLRTALDCS